ncbi:MAG: glycosyltransferase 87 family protein, partial [Thermoanaerobaculales bacterium]
MGSANTGSTDMSEPPVPSDQTSLASGAEKQPRIAGRLASKLSEWLDALQARQPGADREMLAALAVAMVLFSVFPVANFLLGRFAMDYDLWYFTAQNFLHHRPIYPTGTELSFIYPPSAAAMLAVPAALGRPLFILALVALNSLAWASCANLTVWLVTSRSTRQHPLLTLLPSLAMIFWIWDTYLLGQPALVLLALMLGAAACLRLGRPAFAGVMVGTAAAIKAFPI